MDNPRVFLLVFVRAWLALSIILSFVEGWKRLARCNHMERAFCLTLPLGGV